MLWSLWLLHALVIALAVFSAALGGFSLWIDLPQLGWGLTALEYLWAASALAAPVCAGPWLSRRAWIWRGMSPRGARWLLGPTWLMIACLIADTVRYALLLRQDKVDWMVPMPLIVAALLGTWAGLTLLWTGTATSAPPRRQSFAPWLSRAAGWTAPALLSLLVGAGIALGRYPMLFPRQGAGPVAVVLGGGVRGDASAPVEVRYRVKAAADAYQRHEVSRVILSGAIFPAARPGGSERSELEAMRTVALADGIPEEALVIDPVGVNTRATACNTVAWMQASGITGVTICTSPSHLLRTVDSFAEYGGAAIDVSFRAARNPDWSCANPQAILREMVGNFIYWIDPHYREPMAMQLQLKHPRVVVKKAGGVLELYDGGTLRKTYKCITGRNAGDKAVEGDASTPVGTFHIVFKNPFSKFHLSLGLDYPTREDADRGLAQGLITPQEHDDILAALQSDLTKEENQKKLWYTRLGGEIFIHGHGEGRTGTAGCVALSNADVEEIYAALPLGTEVEIVP